MKYHEILNCFINGAIYAYGDKHHQLLIDEDLSMAFDKGDEYARANPHATIAQAHAAGSDYIKSCN